MDSKNKILGLVIVDGVGFRNYVLSDFLDEASKKYDSIILFSGLPNGVYTGFTPPNTQIVELDDFKESFFNWIFRKTKEIAHLQKNKKNNFGILDNLNSNYPSNWSARSLLTRLIFLLTRYLNNEKWINIYNRLQQKSFSRHPSTLKYLKLLAMHQPEVLFFTHQRPPYIAPLIFAAQKMNIPTASFIFSWDNLASKGRMAGDFNFYFVWSELMKKELQQFYTNINENQISVVGTPQFEPYVLERYYSNRNDFYKRFKLNQNLLTICYSCGDVSTSKNDGLYIETIARAVIQNEFGKPLNFLVRTSPAEDGSRFKTLMEKYPHIKWNIPLWELSRKGHTETWSQRVPTIQDMKDLRAILAFCDVGINMCSTMSLDFMCFDKPVINPVFGTKDNGLYNDQRFLEYAHYQRVVNSGAVELALDETSLINEVKEALNNPGLKRQQRNELIKLQVGKPLEGTGKRITKSLYEINI